MTDVLERPSAAVASPPPHRRTPRLSWMEEARALTALAGPLVLTQLAQMAIMTTDLLLLGRFSQVALAAAAIGGTIWYLGWLAGGGPASAVSPMIAQHIGARPRARGGVRAALRMGLWAVLLTSALMTPVLWSATPILLALGQDPQLARMAGRFVAMLSFGLPFSLGYMVLRNFATALGRPHAALWVAGATIAFNALAGWTLVFGHFGAPRLGIVGSGLATSCSQVFSFAAMVVVIRLDPRLSPYRMFRRFGRPAAAKLAEVFRLGLPIGMTMIFEAMLFNTMTLVMGAFGAASLAAHQIAINVSSITFMVPLGLGMASTVRVGLAAGSGELAGARRAGLVAFCLSTGFMLACGAVIATFSRQIAGLYLGGRAPGDLAVIALAASFLKVAAAFQIFDAIQVVGAMSLRGLKDARMPMILAGGAYWLIGAPACLILSLGLHLHGLGIWFGFGISLASAAGVMSVRFWLMTTPRGAYRKGRLRT